MAVLNDFLYEKPLVIRSRLWYTNIIFIMEIGSLALTTTVTLDVTDVDDAIDIGESLEEMNQVSFNVLIQHITKSFVKDFVKGFSDKVKAGVNENE